MPEIPLGTVVGPQGPPGPKGDTGTFSPEDLQRISNLESGKVDKVSGKGLSTNDYTTADKNAVATIGNKVDKVSGKGLSTNDYTDADKAKVAAALTQHQDISGKVDKVSGKGLSTNDYTTVEKSKLANIAAEANKTLIDATLSNAGQAADAKATGDSLSAFRELLCRMEIHCTASGNPATFSDADAANVKALSVTLTPTQSGSGEPSPTNIRPISGVSSVSVTRTGKNLLRIASGSQTINGVTFTVNQTAGTINVNGSPTGSSVAWFHFANVTLLPGDYVLSGGANSKCLLQLEIAGDVVYHQGYSGTAFTVHSTATGAMYIRAQGSQINNTLYPMISFASANATFEPYQGQTVTASLTDGSNPLTVYGGTLDVTTGTLSVTWANIASYNGETLPGRWISDRDVYAPGTTPTTGAQVVYELAAPVTYQLTPAQLATLSGYNAVSTDAASVSVTYKADKNIILIILGGG